MRFGWWPSRRAGLLTDETSRRAPRAVARGAVVRGAVVWGASAALAIGIAMFGAPASAQSTVSFPDWVESFKRDAARAGVPNAVLEEAFDGVALNPRIVELDQRQPEFATPIWTYLGRLVSDVRIQDGRAALRNAADGLAQIEARYSVPPEIVTAIWGVESNFGQNRGAFNVIEALATLAYDGRREAFGRTQLLAALKILASGDIGAPNMIGSWAGAMGHTQFIPTSYQDYAVDFNADGKRDIWAEDPIDALASTANYLSAFGWRKDEPWGFQVILPGGFDYSLVGELRLPTDAWTDRGVRLQGGDPLPGPFDDGELILPAGADGPAFVVLNNFRTIMRYNNAVSYALAVVLLAERIDGKPPRAFLWPEDDRPLTREESKELQEALTELGFDTGGVDGILGRRSRSALRAFQRSQSMIPDGYPSMPVLELVRRAVAAREAPVLAIAVGQANTADVREIQALLSGIGYDTGGVDGLPGPRTRDAISRFAEARGMPPTDEPSLQLLNELRRTVRGE